MRYVVLALVLLGCQAPVPFYPTSPTSAAKSTFRLNVTIPFQVEDVDGPVTMNLKGSATAWVVANSDVSYLITAGHACYTELQGQQVTPEYTLTSPSGQEHAVRFLMRSDDPDLCLMVAYEVLGPSMAVASEDPEYDEPVAYVGAPSGFFGDGMAPMFRGTYSGGDSCSLPGAPGASGSAVFTEGGVIGVLTRVNGSFFGQTFIETRSELLEFLRQAKMLQYLP